MNVIWISYVIVFCSAVWLIGLAVLIVVAPSRADGFLRQFASSRRAHVLEQVLRLVAGLGMVGLAAEMRLPTAFRLFGWVLVGSAVILLALPWTWHRRFGEWVIPGVIRYKRPYAAAALLLGVFLLWALF